MAHTRSIPAFFAVYLLLNLGFIAKVLAQSDVSWDQTSLQVTQGDDVTITCTVLNSLVFDVVRVSKQGYQGVNTIADRNDVKKLFLETKRYNVSYKYDQDSETATLALTYKGIRGEDAGSIKCEKLGEGSPATVELDVIVPIDSLKIIQIEGDQEREIGEEDEITLIEGKENGVKCKAIVDGSLTVPTVSVKIAEEDKTTLFKTESGSDVIDPNGGLGKNTATTNVTYIPVTINPDFNGKTLTCRAETENAREEETASTILNVQYIPRLTCNKYKHFGIVGESIEIKCEVRSNPPSELMWQWQQGGKTVVIDKEAASVEAEEEEITDDEIKATLKIPDIQANHFTQYTLTAKNDIGSKTITVSLTQGSPPKNHNNHPKDQASKSNPVPQGVSAHAHQGPVCSFCNLLGLLALVCYYLMGQR